MCWHCIAFSPIFVDCALRRLAQLHLGEYTNARVSFFALFQSNSSCTIRQSGPLSIFFLWALFSRSLLSLCRRYSDLYTTIESPTSKMCATMRTTAQQGLTVAAHWSADAHAKIKSNASITILLRSHMVPSDGFVIHAKKDWQARR